MKLRTRMVVGAAALLSMVIGSEAIRPVTGTAAIGIVGEAEARVGRPLTPVSVAGVGRRTVRRCAAGVYNC